MAIAMFVGQNHRLMYLFNLQCIELKNPSRKELSVEQEVNSIALLKSQQTFQQSFYSSVGHPVVLETLLKSLLRFQQSY